MSAQQQHNIVHFSKMHGLGNDFVVIEQVTQAHVHLDEQTIKQLADRHRGIGFDQLLVVAPPSVQGADFDYIIYNADGSQVEQCGNGARCFAEFVYRKGLTDKHEISVNTSSGIIRPKRIKEGAVCVDMGPPSFDPTTLPFNPEDSMNAKSQYPITLSNQEIKWVGAVSMGNPHAVLLVNDINGTDVKNIGTEIESHPAFPQRVNVGFMEIIHRNHAKVRVYERGAGETFACGTGACAAAAFGQKIGKLDSKVTVELRGGNLEIEWEGAPEESIFLSGDATFVFDGSIELPTL